MISYSAVKQDNQIYIGRRHFNCFKQMALLGIKVKKQENVQGFLTDKDEFLEREEAGKYAIKCGQIKVLKWPPLLYSEDLWEGK